MKALLSTCLLFGLFSPGSPIQCEVDHSIRTLSKRSTYLKTCDPEFDACRVLVIEATWSGKTVRTVKKSCTKSESCVPGPVFMHLDNGLRETGYSTCCPTDGCNSEVPALPTWNETQNGFWCPSCSVKYPEPCKREIIRCQGSANKCFFRVIGPIIHMGCATESFCNNSVQTGITITDSLGVLLSSQHVECVPAHRG
ncbi:phospholipase A2 inhibitor and Ly6/PLAUR domain-containing protein-like [Eublepharis macularius]|uniref:Phospholipase A2 inhibitor and Ly6/PLAUR domain-containing protein-like n=1 Tax=Eublepharis macularius TaxID=481883 RepID=A0AA97KH13_EUBMA|nr:phospholipase A2 inhibitor and Ly6/PLAUR domain-containing protein-like [Eublepharis macularius]